MKSLYMLQRCLGGVEEQLHTFVISVLCGGEWLASCCDKSIQQSLYGPSFVRRKSNSGYSNFQPRKSVLPISITSTFLRATQ